jgi:hypothetical protein
VKQGCDIISVQVECTQKEPDSEFETLLPEKVPQKFDLTANDKQRKELTEIELCCEVGLLLDLVLKNCDQVN